VDTGTVGERPASAPPLPPVRTNPPPRAAPTRSRVGVRVAWTETLAHARARATANPHRRALIAVVDLPDNGQCGIVRTGQRAGHSTVWGDADALRAAVVAVLPVAREEERHA